MRVWNLDPIPLNGGVLMPPGEATPGTCSNSARSWWEPEWAAERRLYKKTIADRLIFRFLSPPDSSEIIGLGNLAQTDDQSPHEGVHKHV